MSLFETGIPEPKPEVADALPEAISVADYLSQVSGLVRSNCKRVWMWGEISEYAVRGGHHYFSLVAPRGDKPTPAKARAALFANAAPPVLKTFKEVTGSDPRVGMRILILAQAQFDPTYGLTLIVSQIDATYTVGDAEARLRAMRKSLETTGDLIRQRNYRLPRDFTRLAIIAPDNAAGLGDFRAQSDQLSLILACDFNFYWASFQGKDVEGSMLRAIQNISDDGPFDALIVIRGGGAKADLAELNVESVARRLARMPYPIITGIGHERDNCLLDEIACQRFDTPSKVIAHIENTILMNAVRAKEVSSRMAQLARAASESALRNAAELLERQRDAVRSACRDSYRSAQTYLKNMRRDAIRNAQRTFESAQETRGRLFRDARKTVESQERLMSMRFQSIQAYSPKQQMQLGYTIARGSDGHLIKTAEQARSCSRFDLTFYDGPVTVAPSKGT